ncbi:transmembrane protein C2orf18 [Trichuris trichiura]|uniref:Transmembrane protein C2orf18 n=1 Tax=Trichuris trichiura TaxID=36087 RepID=A0A077ZAI3_TRITR|nr:transmembrane protein C2orf18 [Trichuris trichiura]
MEDTGRKWTSYQLFLAFLMVSTGTLNTLAAKWADMMYSIGRPFSHPFLQSLCMFIGEFSCLPTFLIIKYIRDRRKRSVDFVSDETQLDSSLDERPKFNVLIFLPATLCDMTATSIMYVGLTMTNASSFQMLRGATIIFTGIFSVAFLGMTLKLYKWLGMLLVLCGLVIVGLSDLLFADSSGDSADPKRMISGDLLILIAQIIIALQMVYEQRFVNKYNVPPLLVVGLEGLFGCILMTIICVCFYFVKAQPPFTIDPEMRLENVLFAFRQISANSLILLPILGLIVSIAFFNFAGISVTKEIDAPTRMVLDSVRVFFIWAVSLLAGWQHFVLLQVTESVQRLFFITSLKCSFKLGGFFVLLFGMVIYNDIFLRQFIISKLKQRPSETVTVPSEEQS